MRRRRKGILRTRVKLPFLPARFCDGEEECAVESVLLAVCANGRFGVLEDVASVWGVSDEE